MPRDSKLRQLHIELLGGFGLRIGDGPPISLKSRKAEAIVAYLACGRRPFTREEVASFFWPDSDPQQALANLRKLLSELRRPLAPYLLIDRQTIALQPESCWLDVAEFTRLTAVADQDSLATAVALYHGDFLTGLYLRDSLPFDEWATLERERLQRLALAALRQLASYRLHQGQYEQGLTYVSRWLTLDPLAEAAHRLTMRLYARRGQRNAALAQYAACQRILAAELGVDPMPETSRLYERIRATPAYTPPYDADLALIGREAELSQISRQLDDPAVRLLTITGPGGVGKTRLAQQAAARCAPDFHHGVYFVALNAVALNAVDPNAVDPNDVDPNDVDLAHGGQEAILGSLATSLDLPHTDKQSLQKQLLHYLRSKETLLVLDNFEEFLAAAGLIQTILDHAPQVKCLVTSRLPLQLSGEWTIGLTGLPYPERPPSQPQLYGALTLFEANVRQVAPDFVLTTEVLPHVIHICQLVDGLPLGLELAARTIRAFSPAQIAAQLQKNLDFLSSPARDLPQRHRSLRFVFNYSWDLLPVGERADFAALTIFPAPFTDEAAYAATGVTAVTLHRLTQKGLLQPMADGYYQMHNLLRHYGLEKAQEDSVAFANLQSAYAHYYANLLQQLQPCLEDQRQQEALHTIRRNWPHLLRAWQWGLAQTDLDLLDQIILPACYFLTITGLYQEAADLLRQTISLFERPSAPIEAQSLHIHCLVQYGGALCRLAQYDTADQILAAAMAQAQLLNARPETAACYREQGNLALMRGRLDQAEQDLRQSLTLYQAEEDERGEADVWHRLGQLYIQLSQSEQAHNAFSRSLALYRRLANPQGTALALGGLGLAAHYWGDNYRDAELFYLEALRIKRTLGYRHGIAKDLNNLGNLACNLKEFEQAITYYEESLAIKRDAGLPLGIAITLSNLGTAYQELGHYERAVALYEESLGISQKLGDQLGVLFCLANLAELAHVQGQYSLSERRWRRVLRLSLAAQTPDRLLYCMTGLACLWADPAVTATNQPQAAAMLYYVQAHPSCNQSIREKSGPPLAHLAQLLPEDALVAAQAKAAAWELPDIEALLAAGGE